MFDLETNQISPWYTYTAVTIIFRLSNRVRARQHVDGPFVHHFTAYILTLSFLLLLPLPLPRLPLPLLLILMPSSMRYNINIYVIKYSMFQVSFTVSLLCGGYTGGAAWHGQSRKKKEKSQQKNLLLLALKTTHYTAKPDHFIII